MQQIVKILEPDSETKLDIEIVKNTDIFIFLICQNKSKYKAQINIYHKKSNLNSSIWIRGLVKKQTKIDISGLIKADKNISGKINWQANFLTQNQNSQIYVEPHMEIGSHKIEAEHEVSINRFNLMQMFHLQSRGISKNKAEQILINGFFGSLIDKIRDRDLKEKINKNFGIDSESSSE
jgi:Fe-S cluster assembly scaffold protein SufB